MKRSSFLKSLLALPFLLKVLDEVLPHDPPTEDNLVYVLEHYGPGDPKPLRQFRPDDYIMTEPSKAVGRITKIDPERNSITVDWR